jgi:glycosyltransferase involved in cell wall biosynthesis
MARLKAQGVPSKLTLIGNGPALRCLQRQAKQLGISERLRWLGSLPNDEVQRQYSHHHVLLFPSLRDSGGVVVLESLAHGLPVVCTDLGGPAVIVTNQCGRVVSTHGRNATQAANEIANHLHHLARNRGLLERLSVGARRRAWDFEFEAVAAAIHPAGDAQVGDAQVDEVLEAAFS